VAELRLRYFAAAAEAAGVEEETVDTAATTTGELKAELLERFGPPMRRVLRSGSLLVDGLARPADDAPLGATVDVLPPLNEKVSPCSPSQVSRSAWVLARS
jgi:molybdopterin converting factor small subunit